MEVETSLLITKTNIPPLRPQLVQRLRLTERLCEGLNYPFVLVSATAGFGKTTLLCEWIHQSQSIIDVAWLSLEEADNDPVRFWEYLIAALRTIHPQIGEVAQPMLHSPQPFPVESVLTPLINDLTNLSKDFFMVFDDYHFIHSQPIHNGITFLLEHLPSKMHLVIATRVEPPLPMARLRGKGTVLEIRTDDLRLTLDEAKSLLSELGAPALSPGDIEALNDKAEGWVVGLKMAAFSMRGEKDIPGFISNFTGSQRYIIDFLIEEVLQRQSPEVQDFLIQTSILERLSGPLCDALTGNNNGRVMLFRLEKDNLFVVPLDTSQEWYRYHHLFAELLRHRLEVEHGKELTNELHQKASRWFEENSFLSDAIEHALAAKDWEIAMKLLESVGPRKEQYGEWATVLKWMRVLPVEVLQEYPYVYYLYGKLLSVTGQIDAAEAILDNLELVSRKDTRLQGEIAAVWMYIARSRGDMTGAVKYAEMALSLLPEDSVHTRGIVNSNLGHIQLNRGLQTEAETALTEALDSGRKTDNPSIIANSASWLSAILQTRGKLHEAFDLCQQSIELVGQSPAASLPLTYQGMILYEWNDLEAALSHLKQADELNRYMKSLEIQEWNNNWQARAFLAKGDIESAQDMIGKIDRLEWDPGTKSAFRAVTVSTHIMIALKQGNLAEAMEWDKKFAELQDAMSIGHSASARVHLYIALGQKTIVANILRARYEITKPEDKMVLIWVRTWQALVANTDEEAVTYLAEALTMAEPEGYTRTFVDEGVGLAPILRRVISRDIKQKYARKLIKMIETEERQRKIRDGEIPATSSTNGPLSEREIEVLKLMAKGLSNQEIAAKLVISLNTAKTHLRHIFEKLETKGRAQAIARAKELELL